MRRPIEWSEKSPEGEKRKVRVSRDHRGWRVQIKAQGQEQWTVCEPPAPEQVEALLAQLENKYRRGRLAYEELLSAQEWSQKICP